MLPPFHDPERLGHIVKSEQPAMASQDESKADPKIQKQTRDEYIQCFPYSFLLQGHCEAVAMTHKATTMHPSPPGPLAPPVHEATSFASFAAQSTQSWSQMIKVPSVPANATFQ